MQPTNEKKVTFMDPSEGAGVSRQVVPGVLLMPDRTQGVTQVRIQSVNQVRKESINQVRKESINQVRK